MDHDFTLHNAYMSVHQDLLIRRSKVKATRAVFALYPSFVMPYMMARTDGVDKALYLRQWGGPFEALA